MLNHVVLYRVKDESRIDEVVALLRSLEGRVAGLLSINVGRNILPSDRAYDLALLTRFASVEDLRTYQDDAFHREVAIKVRERVAVAASVDFLDPAP